MRKQYHEDNSDFFPQSILWITIDSLDDQKSDKEVVRSINSGDVFPGFLLKDGWGFITLDKFWKEQLKVIKKTIAICVKVQRHAISWLSITYSNLKSRIRDCQ